jgi:hypothetical protein
MAKKPTTLHAIINELVDRTNSDSKRLRVLEQRTETISSRATAIEQEMQNMNKHLNKIVTDIDVKIKNQDDLIRKSDIVMKEVIKQMKKLATVSKISELETLIELYNPLKSQFVTREEVERIMQEKKNK